MSEFVYGDIIKRLKEQEKTSEELTKFVKKMFTVKNSPKPARRVAG
jgi:hypothetical protein